MLHPANSIYIPHFAVWPAKRSVIERAVCRLAACSGNNSMQDEFDMLLVIAVADLDTNLVLNVRLLCQNMEALTNHLHAI